ncbi:MAG: hypothetical protein AB1424_13735 [Thermodesulfobacteriota bacterium]
MKNPSIKPTSGIMPVPPDAVRVWRGFCLEGLDQSRFLEMLGSIFIPATVKCQTPLGLTAYLPSVLPMNKPQGVPDEIALVFYESQESYRTAKETLAGRTYSKLHDLVFSPASLSGFPTLFVDALLPDTPYHLFDAAVDWQHGVCRVFVGVRPAPKAGSDFLKDAAAWLAAERARTGRPDGAIVAASQNYLVYWEHWPDADSAAQSRASNLAGLATPVLHHEAAPQTVPEGFWDRYPGLKVSGGETFCFRFPRRSESL